MAKGARLMATVLMVAAMATEKKTGSLWTRGADAIPAEGICKIRGLELPPL